MDPTVTSPVPAKDPMGMDYTPVYADGGAAVRLTPDRAKQVGLLTVAASFGPLPQQIRAFGSIQFAQSAVKDVYAVSGGWIEALGVSAVGDSVHGGQRLFELYVPALVSVDTQYMRAIETGADPNDNPYARAMVAQGLTDAMIRAMREKQRTPGRIPYKAERDYVVTALNVREGAFVTQGTIVMQIAPRDPVWAVMEVPAGSAFGIAPGWTASMTTTSAPGHTFSGKVQYVYPELDTATQTVRVRVVLPNREGVLMPNMYLTAVLQGEEAVTPVVHVPVDAVVRGQSADHVIVAGSDGTYVPREVRLGAEVGTEVAVIAGLKRGERVVTRALFLIDSEASLRASLQGMQPPGQVPAPAASSATNPR
jgi:Cu(I)/Ag(I) efflux system membrane fusion protein